MGEPWILCWKANPGAKVRLFCFPHAGAGAVAYRDWSRELPAEVELWAVQPPGRGTRFGETPLRSLIEIAAEAARAILSQADRPFALFGHSMGALVAFEAARALRRQGREPHHLFVSGRRAPQLIDDEPPMHRLADLELVEEVRRRYDGIPQAVYRDSELLRIILPTVRADLEALETYIYRDDLPLEFPLSAFGGQQDPRATRRHLDAWRKQTRGRFALETWPGGHFYLTSGSQSGVLAALVRELVPAAAYADRGAPV